MFKDVPILLVLFKYFGDKYGARGSRFGHIFGVPKSIAINQESLISHLGIITTLKTFIITLKTKKTHKVIVFAVFCTLLDTVLGPIRPLQQPPPLGTRVHGDNNSARGHECTSVWELH